MANPEEPAFITMSGKRMTETDLDQLAQDVLNDPATDHTLEEVLRKPKTQARLAAATTTAPARDINDNWYDSDDYHRLQNRVPRGHGWTGVTIGAHWRTIVTDIDTSLAELDPNYEIHQIKEKWGGLRYYCSLDDRDDAIAIIRAGEARAWRTCTSCGTEDDTIRSGTILGSSWVTTLCDPCRQRANQAVADRLDEINDDAQH
jgi:hypothetical protein